MGDRVTSHGQQGGITAGQVNIGETSDRDPQPPRKRSWWKIIAGIAAFIAAVAGTLAAFGVLPL